MVCAGEAGVHPGGGGIFVKSEDSKAHFRLYGYAQPTLTATVVDNTESQSWKYADFRMRRARIDFHFDYDGRTQLFLEYDGAPAAGTALVEAWTQVAYIKGLHHARAGKFVSPFSTVNMRSSRALLTVERYLAINTLFGLPATDTQLGLMWWGFSGPDKFAKYQLAVFNGNASASVNPSGASFGGNVRDNNAYKDVVARVELNPIPGLTFGGAVSYDREPAQTLRLGSLSGSSYASQGVEGDRFAYNADIHLVRSRWLVESEWLLSDFTDSDTRLHGGYILGGWWHCGDEKTGGVQPIVKLEYAQIERPDAELLSGPALFAGTAGANIWINAWTRLQVNLIGEYNSRPGEGTSGLDVSSIRPTLLSQLQVKF